MLLHLIMPNALNASLITKRLTLNLTSDTYLISNSDLGINDLTEYVWYANYVGDWAQWQHLILVSSVKSNQMCLREWILNSTPNGTITLKQGSSGNITVDVTGIKKH